MGEGIDNLGRTIERSTADLKQSISSDLVRLAEEEIRTRKKIEKSLNTKVFDWYGLAEPVVTMSQCEHGNYHQYKHGRSGKDVDK